MGAPLGFSAWVMIYVSMIEIFQKAQRALTGALGLRSGSWAAAGAFFAGILLGLLIDRLVPSYETPHETHGVEEIWGATESSGCDRNLARVGMMTAVAIAVSVALYHGCGSRRTAFFVSLLSGLAEPLGALA